MKKYYLLLLLIILAGCTSTLEKAKTLIDNGKYEDALTKLSQIDKNDQDYQKAIDLQSTIYFIQGTNFLKDKNYEKAVENFEKVDLKNTNYNLAVSKTNYCKGFQAKNSNSFNSALDLFNRVLKEDDLYQDAQANIKEIYTKLGSEAASKIIEITRSFQKEYDILSFKFNIAKMKGFLSDIKVQNESIEDKTVKEYTNSIIKGMSKVLRLYSEKDKIEYQGVGGGNAFNAEIRGADGLITNTQRKLSDYLQKNSINSGNNTATLTFFDFTKQISLIIGSNKTKINEKLSKLKNLKTKIQKTMDSDMDLSNDDVNKYFSDLINYLNANINYYTYMSDKIVVNGRGEELVDATPDLNKKENEVKRLKKILQESEDKLLK